jgi:hypothetical protein
MSDPTPASSVRTESVRRSEYLAGLAIGVLFLVPLLMYGPFEEEETELGIFASRCTIRRCSTGVGCSG